MNLLDALIVGQSHNMAARLDTWPPGVCLIDRTDGLYKRLKPGRQGAVKWHPTASEILSYGWEHSEDITRKGMPKLAKQGQGVTR